LRRHQSFTQHTATTFHHRTTWSIKHLEGIKGKRDPKTGIFCFCPLQGIISLWRRGKLQDQGSFCAEKTDGRGGKSGRFAVVPALRASSSLIQGRFDHGCCFATLVKRRLQ
jgi:hypothetical protein